MALDQVGLDGLAAGPHDSDLYIRLGRHIFGWDSRGSYGLFRMGPGYGFILAILRLFFGSSPIWPILFNVIMGALASALVYLLAYLLLKSRAVALVAGGISALSLTSVSLSCLILNDQPFFTIHLAALVCFVQGYRSGRTKWYLYAGLLAGFAAYVRPVGQVLPWVFFALALILPVSLGHTSRLDLIRRAGITGLVMLLMIGAWSVRNYAVNDRFVFGSNGVLTVRTYLIARVAAKTWNEKKGIRAYQSEWIKEDGDYAGDYVVAYDKARDRIFREIKGAPGAVAETYYDILKKNLVAANFMALRFVPSIKPFVKTINDEMTVWLGYVLFFLSLAGLALMVLRRRMAAALILGITYVTFSLLLGLSYWQGSRLHYPAEMAWSIMLAFLMVEPFRYFKTLWQLRRAAGPSGRTLR